jgi:hypothetical protein
MRETLGRIVAEAILFPFFAVGWIVRKVCSTLTLMYDAIMAGFNT